MVIRDTNYFRLAVLAGLGVILAANLHAAAYIEPSLLAQRVQPVSVIVTARDAASAAAAVRAHGGNVTSQLWIVNAVAATVLPAAIPAIGAERGIVSIVGNKSVKPAAMEGWTSDMRILRNTFTLPTAPTAPAAPLLDGGFAIVAGDGTLLIGNVDGSERKRVKLPGGPYNDTPVVTVDGNILVVGDAATVTLLRPNGTTIWQKTAISSDSILTNAVIGTNGTVYLDDDARTLIALNLADGSEKFRAVVGSGRSGVAKTPELGSDGSIYIASDKGDVIKADATTGATLWSYNVGAYALGSPQVAPDGSVIVMAPGKPSLWSFNSNGTLRFTFTAPTTMFTNPLVTASGIYAGAVGGMYALALNGQSRWSVPALTLSGGLSGCSYDTTPVLSLDGTRLHISARGKNLHVVTLNASSGAVVWRQMLGTNKLTLPIVDPEGGVTVGDSAGGIRRFTADGTISHEYRFKSMAVNTVSAPTSSGSLVFSVGATTVAFYGRLPEQYNGRKDVEPGTRNTLYRAVNPVSVDVGADALHKTRIGTGVMSDITGGDVVVAVVDSGVYWDTTTQQIMGPQLQHQFLGQADFITPTCLRNADGTLGGVQYADHCFADYLHSLDAYGHGTHVSGTISNRLEEEAMDVYLGVAPDARIISARVLKADGSDTYEAVIKGIQWVVENRSKYAIRVLNLSISAYATTPYFIDPLNRAAERAWASGIVVLAAAGNTGPFAQTITVPGNDPYVITVGAVNSARTPGYWKDDVVATFSATGPTFDGFSKPDVLAPGSQIISCMYNGGAANANTAALAKMHPDYSGNAILFRMNGTSMATGVASGVVALMLQVNPNLTPDQVKYRLTQSAKWSQAQDGEPAHNTLQQGLGRIWAPDAVLGKFDNPYGKANDGMDVNADLAHGFDQYSDLAFHYQGPVRRTVSDDGAAYGYYVVDDSTGDHHLLGVTTLDGKWMEADGAVKMIWGGVKMIWGGGHSFTGDAASFGAVKMIWGGAKPAWGSVKMIWGGVKMIWGGATGSVKMIWGGGLPWSGGQAWPSSYLTWGDPTAYGSVKMIWGVAVSSRAGGSTWVADEWSPPASSTVPRAAGADQ